MKNKRKNNEKKDTEVLKRVNAFSKKSILESKKYSEYKDALNVILKDDKKYTFEEIESSLKNFYKTEVK